jgi:hypothetical protein
MKASQKKLQALIVIEPQEKMGLMVRVLVGAQFVFSKNVARGEDIVTALIGAHKKYSSCAGVVVRSHVGSFSASRSALVVANVLAATRAVPVHFAEHSLATPAEVYAALRTPVGKFSYEQPPNITMKKPT